MRNLSYVIFGYKGLIGAEIFYRVCERVPDHRIFAFDHDHADISNKQHIKDILGFIRPSVVINCAGLSHPILCEQAVAGAYEVNTIGPKVLAEQCRSINAKLVHFSSYAVFDGNRFQPYSERCQPSPINVLGKSKLEGEKAVHETFDNYMIIRPGWCFSFEGDNFVKDWLMRIDRGKNIQVPPNRHGSPTYVPDLATFVVELVEKDAKGVFHICNSEATTWDGLANTVIELVKAKSRMEITDGHILEGMVKMPTYSVLSTKKANLFLKKELRPWPSALKECLFSMERFKP